MGFVMLRRIKEGDAKGGVIIPKDKFQVFVEFSKEMGRRKIGEIGSSSRGMYRRNIADIIPNWSDICSTADIQS